MNILEMVLHARSLHLRDMLQKKRESNEKELQERELKGKERERIEMDMLIQAGTVINEGTSDDNLVFTATDVRPSKISDAFVQVHQSNDDVNSVDIFENVFAYETQSHVQPEYINDTYVVNQDDRNITPETPYMDPNGGMIEHEMCIMIKNVFQMLY
ncbi:hypothetical protein CTI12_AA084310 [Artemisia annua]|uniref:Uncharacterized protein n=1 Tax=Artemisia annua TaxID=35608 RepID=A0A2U1PG73_ARTAN|nr:hypothetical protein CTI12_AA084310 [Artemisia annua]